MGRMKYKEVEGRDLKKIYRVANFTEHQKEDLVEYLGDLYGVENFASDTLTPLSTRNFGKYWTVREGIDRGGLWSRVSDAWGLWNKDYRSNPFNRNGRAALSQNEAPVFHSIKEPEAFRWRHLQLKDLAGALSHEGGSRWENFYRAKELGLDKPRHRNKVPTETLTFSANQRICLYDLWSKDDMLFTVYIVNDMVMSNQPGSPVIPRVAHYVGEDLPERITVKENAARSVAVESLRRDRLNLQHNPYDPEDRWRDELKNLDEWIAEKEEEAYKHYWIRILGRNPVNSDPAQLDSEYSVREESAGELG